MKLQGIASNPPQKTRSSYKNYTIEKETNNGVQVSSFYKKSNPLFPSNRLIFFSHTKPCNAIATGALKLRDNSVDIPKVKLVDLGLFVVKFQKNENR